MHHEYIYHVGLWWEIKRQVLPYFSQIAGSSIFIDNYAYTFVDHPHCAGATLSEFSLTTAYTLSKITPDCDFRDKIWAVGFEFCWSWYQGEYTGSYFLYRETQKVLDLDFSIGMVAPGSLFGTTDYDLEHYLISRSSIGNRYVSSYNITEDALPEEWSATGAFSIDPYAGHDLALGGFTSLVMDIGYPSIVLPQMSITDQYKSPDLETNGNFDNSGNYHPPLGGWTWNAGCDSIFVEFWIYTTGTTTITLKNAAGSDLGAFVTDNPKIALEWRHMVWQHVLIEVSSGAGILYLNGVELASLSISGYVGKLSFSQCFIDAICCSGDPNYVMGSNRYPLVSSDTPLSFTGTQYVAINPATPEDEFQVRVSLDSRFDFNAGQFGGQDVRFFTQDGESIPYWIESWSKTSKTATIWVKVPEKGTSLITMKYGCPWALPASCGEVVFEIFDGFEDGKLDLHLWNPDTYASRSEFGGALVLYSTSGWSTMASKSNVITQEDGGIVEMRWTHGDTGTFDMDQRLSRSGTTPYPFAFGIADGVGNYNIIASRYYNEIYTPQNGQIISSTPDVDTFVITRLQQTPDNVFTATILNDLYTTLGIHVDTTNIATLAPLSIALGVGPSSMAVKYDWVRVRKYAAMDCLGTLVGYQEDFESYTPGELNGKVGPLGTWSATTSGATSTIENDGGELVCRQVDSSSGSRGHSTLQFSAPGSPNGVDSVSWTQKVPTGNAWWAISFVEGSVDYRVSVYFDNEDDHVRYYYGDYGDTGLDFSRDTWETFDVQFSSTSTFMIRKDGGAWYGPFQNRGTFGSGTAVAKISFGGSTEQTYDVKFDDIRPSWIPAPVLEDHESYANGQNVNGAIGPVGSWFVAAGGTSTSKIVKDNGDLVLNQIDAEAGSMVFADLSFETAGSPNGADSIRWRQKVLNTADKWFGVSFAEGSTYKITLNFNQYTTGSVKYWSSSSYHDTTLTCALNVWETYEVLFYSTTLFKIRKDGGEWKGPFETRDSTGFSGLSKTVKKMALGGSTWAKYNVMIDDVRPSWMQPRPIEEMFEDAPVGMSFETGRPGWSVSDASTGSATVDTLGGTRYGKLATTSASAYYMEYALLKAGTYTAGAKISFDICAGETDKLRSVYVLQNGGPTADSWSISFNGVSTNPQIVLQDGGSAVALRPYGAGTWYHVTIEFVECMHLFDVIINGVRYTNGLKHFSTALGTATSIGLVRVHSRSSGPGYIGIDNIIASWINAPLSTWLKDGFESIPVISDIAGASGPLGTWSSAYSGSGTASATLFNDGAGTRLKVVDTTSTGAISAKLTFNSLGSVGDVITWWQLLNPKGMHNIVIWQGTNSYIHLFADPSDNKWKYYDTASSPCETGITYSIYPWERYWLKFESAETFKMYKGDYEPDWGTLTVLECQVRLTDTTESISAWESGGDTGGQYKVLYREVALHLPGSVVCTEDFKSYNRIDGWSGPLGTWSATPSGFASSTVFDDGMGKRMYLYSNYFNEISPKLTFNNLGSVGDVITWQQNIAITTSFRIKIWQGSRVYVDLTVQSSWKKWVSINTEGGTTEVGITYEWNTWEQYWLKFESAETFKMFKGSHEPDWDTVPTLDCKEHLTDMTESISVWSVEPGQFQAQYDDIAVSWM